MSVATNNRPREKTLAAPKKVLRPDIQGLRMVAVLAVILDHLVGWPSGGFVGVDVFFVISGFLITGLLLREYEKTGTISFRGFYTRRVKRIIPAAVAVLLVTVVASQFLLNAGRASQTVGDALWSFLFAANWHFAAVGTDYFLAAGATSPLQHFWSLAVEEQFYLVWPWLMLLIFLVAGRSARWNTSHARRTAGIAMAVIVVVSFAWALWESSAHPTVAYFSTVSRTWELGVGALVAVIAPSLSRIPANIRPVLGWLGLVGIVGSVFFITSALAFPAPWAAVPVLSTALVIIAGTGGRQRFLWPLTNRVSGWLGTLSYSLYLWHFPVIILLGALFAPRSPSFFIACIVGIAFFSVASYYLVERPFHISATKEERRRAFRKLTRNRKNRRIFAGSLALVTVLLIVAALVPKPQVAWVKPASVGTTEAGTSATEAPTNAQLIAAAISNASRAASWPTLSPGVANLSEARATEWITDGCINRMPTAADGPGYCVYGDGPKQAVILGDSIAVSWVSTIRAALGSDWTVHIVALAQCPAQLLSVNLEDGSNFALCDEFHDYSKAQVAKIKPDITFISSAENTLGRMKSGATGAAQFDAMNTALVPTLDYVRAVSAHTIVMQAPPMGNSLTVCVTPFNRPADCMLPVDETVRSLSAAESTAVKTVADPTVTYLSTLDWFCTVGGLCPTFSGTTPILADGNHLTRQYATQLAPVLHDAITEQMAAPAVTR